MKLARYLFIFSLLVSCAEAPHHAEHNTSLKVGYDHALKQRRFMSHLLAPIEPLPEPGYRTIDDVLYSYAPYAVGQLQPYFEKAGVKYPPKALTLVGLKEEKKLEIWAQGEKGRFHFIRDYDIKAASGKKGPKLRQGDKQVPEGIYRIVNLNPNSHYHLSMKLNYPNEFDIFHAEREGRTQPGTDIFIHGNSVSAGCLAIGDAAIEELFVLAAHVGAENISVIIAPHDPRVHPLNPNEPGLPDWTEELYKDITDEIVVRASSEKPVTVSSRRNDTSSEAKIR